LRHSPSPKVKDRAQRLLKRRGADGSEPEPPALAVSFGGPGVDEGPLRSRARHRHVLDASARRTAMKDLRALVTGGSGFIGSHLVRRLLALGCRVGVMVRYGNVMKNERLRDVWDRLEVIEADLRNRGALAAVRRFEPQVVFHLAAYNHVGDSFRQVEEC